jgi:hypothetical protein
MIRLQDVYNISGDELGKSMEKQSVVDCSERTERLHTAQFIFFTYVALFAAAKDYYPSWHLLVTLGLYLATTLRGFQWVPGSMGRRCLVLGLWVSVFLIGLGYLLQTRLGLTLAISGLAGSFVSLVVIAPSPEAPRRYRTVWCVQQVSFLLPLFAGLLRLSSFTVVPKIALANIYVASTALWGSYTMIRQGHVGDWDVARPCFAICAVLDAYAVGWIIVANCVPEVRSLYSCID